MKRFINVILNLHYFSVLNRGVAKTLLFTYACSAKYTLIVLLYRWNMQSTESVQADRDKSKNRRNLKILI